MTENVNINGFGEWAEGNKLGFDSWKRSSYISKVQEETKPINPMEVVFGSSVDGNPMDLYTPEDIRRARDINIARESLNTNLSNPEDYDTDNILKFEEDTAWNKLRLLFNARDNKSYTDKEQLQRRVFLDSGRIDPKKAVGFYNDIYNPVETSNKNLQVKTNDPLYKHIKYGFTSTIENSVEGGAKLRLEHGALGALDKMVGWTEFSDGSGLTAFMDAIKRGVDKSELMDTPLAQHMFKTVDDLSGFTDFMLWAEGVNDVIDYELEGWVELKDERDLINLNAPVGNEFIHKVAQGIGQAGVTIPLSMVYAPLGFLNNFNIMYNEGLDAGLDGDAAIRYGEIAGLVDTIGDKLIASKIPVSDKLNIGLKILAKSGINFTVEGTTETYQYLILQKMAGKPVDYKEALDNFIVGGTVGMIVGGGIEISSEIKTKIDNKTYEKVSKKYLESDLKLLKKSTPEILEHPVKVELNEAIEEVETQLKDKKISIADISLTKLKNAIDNMAELGDFMLHGISAEFNNELTPAQWKDLKTSILPEDLQKSLASFDEDSKALLIRAINGDLKAQKVYNNSITIGRIAEKINAGEELSKTEQKIVKDQYGKDVVDAEPNDPELKEVYRKIISDTVNLKGFIPITRSISQMSHLKLYPRIANRIRFYESSVNTYFRKQYKTLQGSLEALHVLERISSVGLGRDTLLLDLKFTPSEISRLKLVGLSVIDKSSENVDQFIRESIDDINLAIMEGDFANVKILTQKLLTFTEVLSDKYGYITEEAKYLMDVGAESYDQLTDKQKAVYRNKHPYNMIRIKTKNDKKLSRSQDLQFRRLYATIYSLNQGFMDGGKAFREILTDASKILGKEQVASFFPRQVDDVDGLRAYIRENNIATQDNRQTREIDIKEGIVSTGSLKNRTVVKLTKGMLRFYANPAIALENYLIAVSRTKAKASLLYGSRAKDVKLAEEHRINVIELENKLQKLKTSIKNTKDVKIKAAESKLEKAKVKAEKALTQAERYGVIEANDDGTFDETDTSVVDEDIISIISKDIDLDTATKKEIDALVNNIKSILTPDTTNKFNKLWRKQASVKYVSGPTTILKQYMDMAVTAGELVEIGGINEAISILFKQSLKNMDGWTNPDGTLRVDADEMLEEVGAEMTEPDIEKAHVPLSGGPLAWIKEIIRINKDYKMNKSYKRNMLDILATMAEGSKGQDKLDIIALRAKIEVGEAYKGASAWLQRAEAHLLTGLRMSDKFNRMKTLSWRVKQITNSINTDFDMGVEMITNIIHDPVLAKIAAQDIKNKKITDASRLVMYTILADRQPLNPGETSSLFKHNQLAKPFGMFKSFAFKEAARHMDMVVIPATKSMQAFGASATYFREGKRLSYQLGVLKKTLANTTDEVEIANIKIEITETQDNYQKVNKQSKYAAKLGKEYAKEYQVGLKMYTLYSVLPNAMLNMAIDSLLVTLGWKAEREDDEDEDGLFANFVMEFVGRLFPLISAYDIVQAIDQKDPTKIFEGFSRLPLGIGSMTLWQLMSGVFDKEDGIELNPMLEDIPPVGRYIQEYYD